MAYRSTKARRNTQVRNNQRNARMKENPLAAWYASINWGRVRIGLAGGLFVLMWFVLWGRAAYIQLLDDARLAERARRQHTAVEMVTGQRGRLLDRNGQVLARNVECRSVYVNPREVTDASRTANTLASILQLPVDKILPQIRSNRAFVWISRKIDDATAQAIRTAALPGVGLVKEYERIYPFKQVAGQLLGFTDVDNAGREGLERAFDSELSGLSEKRVVRRDGAGRRFYTRGEEVPSGQDVKLTIDVQIQFLAEEALAAAVQGQGARWAGALVVDVPSGDILAWAQYPFFNPNARRTFTPALYRNRLALDALEPGSTLKPLLVAAALQEGIINRDTIFDCENGTWKVNKTTIRDDRRSYGKLPVHQILGVSSNIGSAKIGLALGAPRYHGYLSRLGFGQRTGLHIAESKGILHPVRDWSETDTMAISFGQGMAATVLQMGQAYLTLGNKGVYKPLRLVQDESTSVPGDGQRIFSERVSNEVLRMMYEVVEEGTGSRAKIPGVQIAGKTGTAQKADQTGKYGTERTASFVGFVPALEPKYLVIIMIDEPQKSAYGGLVAAPVFKDMVTRTLAYVGTPPEPPVMQAETESVGKQAVKAAQRAEIPAIGTAGGDMLLAAVYGGAANGEHRYDISNNIQPSAGSTVPDVVGKSVRMAVEMFVAQGIVPVLRGEGSTVVRQSPSAGTRWEDIGDGQEFVLWISEK